MLFLAIVGIVVAIHPLSARTAADEPSPANVPSIRAIGGSSAESHGEVHRLRLYHTHTAESIDIVYRQGDRYVPEAIAQLDYFLRDHRTGAVRHFDPRLFDLLSDLASSLGRPDAEIDVVCGYRTPWSNAYLREHTRGVARHSLHMQAMAIDIRVPGISTRQLQLAALTLHRGGVGYYAHSQFVHVDVGAVRRW